MAKPITLYGHISGPNPWKVAIVLEELGLPYDYKVVSFPDMKKEPYESKNPNGRVPAIDDPNTGITLFESGAIIEYLIDTYDTTHILSYPLSSPREHYLSLSWLHFQMSGQGPYFGQKAWFSFFHVEKNLTSVLDRYANEIKRVVGVIDRHLKTQGTQYLVGEKCTFADLSFVMWDQSLPHLVPDFEIRTECPHFTAWNDRVSARASVKKVLADKEKMAAAEKK
ncbi:glutathione-s-transferase theta, gst [Lepidopterella palustris CBS 459.81]|uniref:Glutathione-s-transferase theta, gst n=1 Tax=Lepidopterella palustris CBS 459.81 TaxID=1314670 RepID=A0A8E2ED51_9PEZI|nr:glutathione-s-transferase theta, gst [Lepidopterella palustris CBS 459.81]